MNLREEEPSGRVLEDEELIDGGPSNDDEAIRKYIRKQIKKFGGVSTENVRKTFGIGWIRAKRLHDQEMGLKTDEVRYASDEKLRHYIRSCFEEKGSCSVNHLRQEFNVGYNRAKKILDEEKERVEYALPAEDGALATQLLGLGSGGRKGRQVSKRANQKPAKHVVEGMGISEEASMQGLEEDASYLLGMSMGISVTQREKIRGRTEDETICENALQTMLLSTTRAKRNSGAGIATRSVHKALGSPVRSETKWTKLENAREELQRQLEEAKEERKKLREVVRDTRADGGKRRRGGKTVEMSIGADMAKLKAKMLEIEGLREQLDVGLKRAQEERERAMGDVPGSTAAPTTQGHRDAESEGERMTTRKRRRQGESKATFADRLHKLIQTTADLQKELTDQHIALQALPSALSVASPIPSLPAAVASAFELTSSLLSACLLSITSPPPPPPSPRPDEELNDVELAPPSISSSSSNSPVMNQHQTISPSPASPLPVTFTYPVPTLSSQDFIKSLEALTSTTTSRAFSAAGSLSFTIPGAPPPSLASSLSFTSLPPPLPTFVTSNSAEGAHTSLPTVVSSSSSSSIFFPPPPLPTLPVSGFPVEFPYGDYIVARGSEELENELARQREGRLREGREPSVQMDEEKDGGEDDSVNRTKTEQEEREEKDEWRVERREEEAEGEADDAPVVQRRKRGRPRKDEGKNKRR